MKKALAIILTLCMVISLLPGLALAVEPTPVADETALRAAITNAASGDTIKLTTDITIASQLNIGKDITLDGDGHKLTRTPSDENVAKGERAAILVTATGATIKDITVIGPNTKPISGTTRYWDDGDFGIKVWAAGASTNPLAATLTDVKVTGANAGILVSNTAVTMTGTIDVSGNEWGGIELCKGGTLDLSDATLKNDNETEDVPVLWNDDTKGDITPNTAQTLYVKAADETKDHYYLSGDAKIGDVHYRALQDAVGAATNATPVELLKNITLTKKLTISKSLTIDGKDKTITGVANDSGVYFEITGGTVVIKNATVTGFGSTAQTNSGIAVFKVFKSGDSAPNFTADHLTIKNFCRSAFDIRAGEFAITNCDIDCASSSVANLTKGVLAGLGGSAVTGTISDTKITNSASSYAEWSASGIEIYNPATVTVEDCTISGVENGIHADTYWGTGDVSVTVKGTTSVTASGDALSIYADETASTDNATLTVEAGKYSGGYNIENSNSKTKIAISGGYFTADPTAYVAEGKYVTATTETGYKYTIANIPTEVKVTEPAIKVDAPVDTNETIVAAVAETSVSDDSAADLGTLAASSTLTKDGKIGAKTVDAVFEDTNDAYNNLPLPVAPSDSPAPVKVVVVQPYMDIKVVEAVAPVEGDNPVEPSLTLNITPMSQVFVTRSDVDKLLVANTNAIAVGNPQKLTVTEAIPVALTVGIPAALAVEVSPATNPITYKPLTIKHQKDNGQIYYYDAVVTRTGEGEPNYKYFASFTVTHGFSAFTLTAADTRKLNIDYDVDGVSDATNLSITDVGMTLPTAAKTGFIFDGWEFTKADGAAITDVTGSHKTLPDLWAAIDGNENISVKATAKFSSNPPAGDETFTLTFNTNGGSAVAAVTKAKGSVIDLSGYTTAKDKYAFVGWYSDAALTTLVTSVTLNADTTVYAKWVEKPATVSFTDVKDSDWFYDDVAYAFNKGLMNGVSKTEFDPHGTTTRGMIVTMLYRLAGEPNVVAANPFKDVAAGMYYTKPVIWAATNKIVDGYSAEKFGPEDPITREQMAKILYTYAKFKGQGVSQAADLGKFTDASKINSWALDAMKWAVAMKLVEGDGTALNPGGYAERCQVAAIFHRFCK